MSFVLLVAVFLWLCIPVAATPIMAVGGVFSVPRVRAHLSRFLCWGLLMTILLLLLSLIWSHTPDTSTERVVKLLPLIGLGFVLMAGRDVEWNRWIPPLLSLPLVLIIWEHTQVLSVQAILSDEFVPALYNKPLVLLSILMPLFCVFMVQQRDYTTLICFAIVLFWAVFSGHSATAKLACLALPLCFIAMRFIPRTTMTLFLFGYSAFALSFPFWIPYVSDWALSLWINQVGFGAYASRLEIWAAIAQRVAEQPWLGYGVEATRGMTNLLVGAHFFWHDSVLHPHNMVLQLWVEMGLLGVVVHLVFIWALAWRILRHDNWLLRAGLFASFFAGLVALNLSFGIWQSWFVASLFLVAYVAKPLWRVNLANQGS